MKKDGHSDVASSRKMCNVIIEDAQEILSALPLEAEISLPTWWTNKLALCSAYMNSSRDYLIHMESASLPTDDTVSKVHDTSNSQVQVGEYLTKHFDMCPAAQELYSEIKDKTDMIHLIVEAAMLHDLFFKVEKQIIAMGAADDDAVNKAQHYAMMILNLAEEMNLVKEHFYIEQVHMTKIHEIAASDKIIEINM